MWTNAPIKILGICISQDDNEMLSINFDTILDKAQVVGQSWHCRGLTLMGKVLVINSLIASLFVYKMSVLCTMKTHQFTKIKTIIKNFLWDGGKPKMALEKLYNVKEYGGLKLINLEAKDQALKTQWVSTIKNFEKIQTLSNQFLPPIGQDFWLCNTKTSDIANIISQGFWRDVAEAWSKVNWYDPTNPTQIAAQPLWFNSRIKIQNKLVYFENAHKSGIFFIYNIWNSTTNQFLEYPHLVHIYGQSISFLEYYGLIAAIPSQWIKELKTTRHIVDSYQLYYENFNSKQTATVYVNIVSKKETLRKLHQKWQTKIQTNIHYDQFLECFDDINQLVYSTKMRNFQFRFLHRIIFTGDILYKWKIVDSPLCTYCRLDYETLEHLFYKCSITIRFWEMLFSWFEALTDTEVNPELENVCFCNYEEDKLLSTIILLAKQHIFSRKCIDREPNVYIFKDSLMQLISIERYQALKTKKYKPFVKKWQRLFTV